MGILNIFGKKDATTDITNGPPFSVSTELFPYKLQSKKNSTATLIIRVKNLTKEILLTSVVAETPNAIGFDEMTIAKQKETRIGEMQPGESKEIKLTLYSSLKSEAGEYTLTLTAIAHYRDYGHVLNAVKKRVSVDVI